MWAALIVRSDSVIMSVSDTVVQNQSCHSRETTYPVIDAHAGVCKKVFRIICSISEINIYFKLAFRFR